MDYTTHTKFHNAGIQVDILGQPLKVGDIVLTKGYYSPDKNTFALVTKVNKKSIMVDIPKTYTEWGEYAPMPTGYDWKTQGPWDYYPNRQRVTIGFVKRTGFDCLKISPEFKEQADQTAKNLQNEYPEIFI